MKLTQMSLSKQLAIAAATMVLPLSIIAFASTQNPKEICARVPPTAFGMPMPFMFETGPPGALPMPPFLRQLELTESQENTELCSNRTKLFLS